MANKNTKRSRRSRRQSNKSGKAVNSENGGRFRPRLDPAQEKQVKAIQEQSRKLYGHSA